MPEIKYTDVLSGEIDSYLLRIENCIVNERYKISDKNREDNINFINKYSLTKNKIIKMIRSLKNKDFSFKTPNIHENMNNEILYVFKKIFELDYYGELKIVEVYIKFNIILRNCQDFCFIVSFHE